MIVGEAQFPRALTLALYGILAKSCRPRVTTMIENVLGIDAETLGTETCEGAVLSFKVDITNAGEAC